jgi:hypothetical protein
MLIAQSILLVPSYYAGWIRGDHYYDSKLYIMNCYSLSTVVDYCLCKPSLDPNCIKPGEPLSSSTDNEIFNYFLENNLSFFNDKNFNSENEQDVKFFKTTLHVKAQSGVGFTEIETINDSLVFEDKSLIIENPLVTINGWSLDENKKELDSIYLIVNGEPFLKYDHFYPRNDIAEDLGLNMDNNAGWTISFLSGYLKDDCQKITLVGVKDDRKIEFENEIQLCKN